MIKRPRGKGWQSRKIQGNAFLDCLSLLERLEFVINYEEVSRIIELPLSALMHEECMRDDLWMVNGEMKYKPSFGYKGHLIFGATARILDCLVQTLPDKSYNL